MNAHSYPMSGDELVREARESRHRLIRANWHRHEASRLRDFSRSCLTESDRIYWSRQADREIANAEYHEGMAR